MLLFGIGACSGVPKATVAGPVPVASAEAPRVSAPETAVVNQLSSAEADPKLCQPAKDPLHAACANVSSEGVCPKCPAFTGTGADGVGDARLELTLLGSFASPAPEALVAVKGCEGHVNNWGGTLLTRQTEAGWNQLPRHGWIGAVRSTSLFRRGRLISAKRRRAQVSFALACPAWGPTTARPRGRGSDSPPNPVTE